MLLRGLVMVLNLKVGQTNECYCGYLYLVCSGGLGNIAVMTFNVGDFVGVNKTEIINPEWYLGN